jgi:hypothetical protein
VGVRENDGNDERFKLARCPERDIGWYSEKHIRILHQNLPPQMSEKTRDHKHMRPLGMG